MARLLEVGVPLSDEELTTLMVVAFMDRHSLNAHLATHLATPTPVSHWCSDMQDKLRVWQELFDGEYNHPAAGHLREAARAATERWLK